MNSLQNPGKMTERKEPEIAWSKCRRLQTNPLEMGNILENVLFFLDVNSIKSSRRVNKLWSAKGAKVLITKCYIKISPDLLVGQSTSNNSSKSLDEFKAFLSHKLTEVSMIPKITVGAARDIELWKSVGVLGKQVKSLKLYYIEAKLLHGLLDLLPNLKYLDIQEDPGCVKRGDIVNILTSVMSVSKLVNNQNRSPLVISRMSDFPRNEKELEDLEKFSQCTNIMIENFHFFLFDCSFPFVIENVPNVEARIAKALSKLLLTSKNTLKQLRLFDLELYLSLLEFPRMNALTRMILYLGKDEDHNLLKCFEFPPSFRFSENIPQLEHVKIEYWGDEDPPGLGEDLLTSLFEKTGPALPVKYLKYRNKYSKLNTDQLFKTFPNIEDLKISGAPCYETMFHSLWTFGKNIKNLEISIDLDDDFDGDYPSLDCYFTGFAPETVDKIKESPTLTNGLDFIDNVENLRINPSMLNLTDLQVLKIRYNVPFGENNPPKRVLAVAGEFTFKLMPNTQVVIELRCCSLTPEDFDGAFGEVDELPNVTIV